MSEPEEKRGRPSAEQERIEAIRKRADAVGPLNCEGRRPDQLVALERQRLYAPEDIRFLLDQLAEAQRRATAGLARELDLAQSVDELRAELERERGLRTDLCSLLREYFNATPAIIGGPNYRERVNDQEARRKRLKEIAAVGAAAEEKAGGKE